MQQLGIISLRFCDKSGIFVRAADSSACLQKGCPGSQPFCLPVHGKLSLFPQQIPIYHPERSDVDVALFQLHFQINISLSLLCSVSWKGDRLFIYLTWNIWKPQILKLLHSRKVKHFLPKTCSKHDVISTFCISEPVSAKTPHTSLLRAHWGDVTWQQKIPHVRQWLHSQDRSQMCTKLKFHLFSCIWYIPEQGLRTGPSRRNIEVTRSSTTYMLSVLELGGSKVNPALNTENRSM